MRHHSELILKPVVCRNSLADIVIPEGPLSRWENAERPVRQQRCPDGQACDDRT